MRIGTKGLAVLLCFISAYAAPAAAQSVIDPTGDGGSFNVSTDVYDNVSKLDSGTYTINITSDGTLHGDVGKGGITQGTLRVSMDEGGRVTGTAMAEGEDSVVEINGGYITSRFAGEEVLEVENGGLIHLGETTAEARRGNLLDTQSSGSVVADGSVLIGDIVNKGTGNLDVTLDAGSILEGTVSTNAGGATNLSVASGGEAWEVSGSSDLGQGSLENGGVVNLAAASDYITVKAGDLGAGAGAAKSAVPEGAADGVFGVKMDTVAETSDKLQIANSAAGSYTITAQANDASAKTSGNERFSVVEIGGESSASFALSHEMELGAWMYTLRAAPNGAGTVWEVGSNGPSNVASAAVNAVAAGYLMGYAETGTLMQRMGDLRGTPMLSGFWARAHGGKFDADDMAHGKEFDLKYGGVHVGYDRKIETGLPGDFYAGVMFGYSKGDINFAYAGGDGDVDSKMIGVYGTYKQKNGVYVDALLKYQWINQDFDTFDSTGAHVTTNDINTSGLGFSIETGQKFAIDKGWYATPRLGLSYMRQNNGYFNASNGLRIGVEGYTSLIGSVGITIGYENAKHNFYATVARAKEFEGDLDFYANTMPIHDGMDDSWWVYGIGYSANLDDKNQLYIDVERASGGVFEQDWSVRAGWRMIF